MSILGSSWGVAIIIGPAFGGLLSQPAVKYPAVFSETGLFGSYPYLLPCMLTAVMAVPAALMLVHWVPESLQRIISNRSDPALAVDEAGGDIEDDDYVARGERSPMLPVSSPSSSAYGQGSTDGDVIQPPPPPPQKAQMAGAQKLVAPRGSGSQQHWSKQRAPRLVLAITGLMNMFVIADDDVMPLWGAAPRNVGGLGLDTQRIGAMLGAIGLFILLMFLAFAPLNNRIGTLGTFKCSAALLIPMLLLTPAATLWAADSLMWSWLLCFGAAKATWCAPGAAATLSRSLPAASRLPCCLVLALLFRCLALALKCAYVHVHVQCGVHHHLRRDAGQQRSQLEIQRCSQRGGGSGWLRGEAAGATPLIAAVCMVAGQR
jgi:hypothetical protein